MGERFNTPDVEKKDFLFISYKHDDIDIVDAVISQLYEKGVRIWYDANLHVGEDWTQIAREKIHHPNCRGVIFFNSASSFKSGPVHLERGWTAQRVQARPTEDEFSYFSVNINGASYLNILKQVFDSVSDDAKIMELQFPMDYVVTIASLFDSKVIYSDPTDADACAQELYEAIEFKFKNYPNVIDKDYINMNKLKGQGIGTAKPMVLGVYKHVQAVIDLPSYALAMDGIVSDPRDERVKYMVVDQKVYSTKPIQWSLLYSENDICVLLARDTVHIRHGGTQLNEWIESEFARLSFTTEERKLLREIRLLSQEDMEKTPDKSIFVFEGCDTHWWLSDRRGNLQSVVMTDGTIHNRFNCERISSGVRPVIAVHKDDVEALIK